MLIRPNHTKRMVLSTLAALIIEVSAVVALIVLPLSQPVAGGQGMLNDLYSQFQAGAPFSQEERKMLIRFGSGETLSSLEADTLISRVLYTRFITRKRLDPQQKELLRRYKEFVVQSGRQLTEENGKTSQRLGGSLDLIAQGGTPCVTSAGLISQLGTPCATYRVSRTFAATIVPGTADTGNHCDDCTTAITLPFPFRFYDRSFTTARVSSNGNLQFASNDSNLGGCLPQTFFDYTIFAYYTDLFTQDAASGLGIFTSVSGSAPNRIFNIEWRTRFCCSNGPPVQNFEIRLHEGSGRFDIIYGLLDVGRGASATVGIERDTSCFFQFECNIANSVSPGLMLTFVDYDMCLQDESNGNVLLFNSMTGCYIFTQCSTGFVMTGTGTVTTQGCTTTIRDKQPDRTFSASVNSCTRQGSATVFRVSPRRVTVTLSITDNNIDDNTCACP